MLGLPATFLGVLGAAQGTGSIAGGIVAGRLVTRYGAVAVGAAGAALLALALLARCLPWWPVTLGSGVAVGVGLPWTLMAAITTVQITAPAEGARPRRRNRERRDVRPDRAGHPARFGGGVPRRCRPGGAADAA